MRTKCALVKLNMQTDEAHSLMIRALERHSEQSTVIEKNYSNFGLKMLDKPLINLVFGNWKYDSKGYYIKIYIVYIL